MSVTTPNSFWKFDESSGNAADSSGNGNTLTNNNSATYVTGLVNNAASLAKSGSKTFSVTDAAQTGLDPTTGFSASFWVKFTDTPHGLGESWGLGQKYDGSGQSSYAIAAGDVANQNQLYFIYTSTGTADTAGNYSEWDSNAQFFASGDVGNWIHVVVVVNASSNSVAIYKNGSSFTITKRAGTATAIYDGTSAFKLGYSSVLGDTGTYKIDAYGFWKNYQLTTDEIAELYNSGSGWQYPPATNVTVNASVLAATLSIPTATITAVKNISVSPSAQSAVFSVPTATIKLDYVVAIAAPLSATFSLPAPTVLIPSVSVFPSALSLTASIPSVTVKLDYAVSVGALSCTFSVPASSVSGAAVVSTAVQAATFSVNAPSIVTDQVVEASVLALTFSLPSITVALDYAVAVSALSATFAIPAVSVGVIANQTLTPSPLSLAFTLLRPTRIGGMWENQSKSSASFTNQLKHSTSWSNQSKSAS